MSTSRYWPPRLPGRCPPAEKRSAPTSAGTAPPTGAAAAHHLQQFIQGANRGYGLRQAEDHGVVIRSWRTRRHRPTRTHRQERTRLDIRARRSTPEQHHHPGGRHRRRPRTAHPAGEPDHRTAHNTRRRPQRTSHRGQGHRPGPRTARATVQAHRGAGRRPKPAGSDSPADAAGAAPPTVRADVAPPAPAANTEEVVSVPAAMPSSFRDRLNAATAAAQTVAAEDSPAAARTAGDIPDQGPPGQPRAQLPRTPPVGMAPGLSCPERRVVTSTRLLSRAIHDLVDMLYVQLRRVGDGSTWSWLEPAE